MADNKQVTGNIGLYYVCYRLSELGWNVMPTSRNARGIDILAYSQDGRKKPTFQVKALSARYAVSLGKRLDHFFADYLIVCRTDKPQCFILTLPEVKQLAHPSGKASKITYWLEARDYETDEFCDRWGLIGSGEIIAAAALPPPNLGAEQIVWGGDGDDDEGAKADPFA